MPLCPVLSSVLPRFLSARALRIFTWVWIACVIVGSLLPGSAKDFIGTTNVERYRAPYDVDGLAHRIWHFGVFGFTAVLLLVQAPNTRRHLYAVLGTFVFGVSLELLQYLVFGGVFEWWDVRDDAIGVAGAFLLFRVYMRWTR
jgi:hypothetical protein